METFAARFSVSAAKLVAVAMAVAMAMAVVVVLAMVSRRARRG